jgi:predicted enzyme related to lactoylglutathione lyase
MKKKVTGIGGIFFKSSNPQATREWYAQHLGFSTDQWGTVFEWTEAGEGKEPGCTVWNPFPENNTYFGPSTKEFMINLRVENLEELLAELKASGIEQIGEMQVQEFGKFAHIMDPDGVKIELWQP